MNRAMATPLVLLLIVLVLVACSSFVQAKPTGQIAPSSNYVTDDAKIGVKAQLEHQGVAMNETDEDYYWFSLHDYNQDGHLDGHELRNAFGAYNTHNSLSMEQAEEHVDHILQEDDTDNDNRVSWEEFFASQEYHEN